MCLPLVAVGLTVAGAAAQFASQSAQASAADKANQAMAKRNQALARQSASDQYNALGERIQQERTKSSLEASSIIRESLQARGMVSAAAVESGVAGQSVDALLGDFERQEGEYLTATAIGEQYAVSQAEVQKRSARVGLESQLLSSTPPIVQRPNLLNAALGAFSSSLSSYLSISGQQASIDRDRRAMVNS